MLKEKKLEPHIVNDIYDVGRYIKVLSCERQFRLIVSSQGKKVLDTDVYAGFELAPHVQFDKVQLISEFGQDVTMWVSSVKLDYNPLSRKPSRSSSHVIEHFGASQQLTGFDSAQDSLRIVNYDDDFYVGGDGVTSDSGILYRAGDIYHHTSAAPVHAYINKRPTYIAKTQSTTLSNSVKFNDVDYDFAHVSVSNYQVTTAHAIYFIATGIDFFNDKTAFRVSNKVQNLTSKSSSSAQRYAVDVIVTNFERDEVAVLYQNGVIETYSAGVMVSEITTFAVNHVTDRQLLGFDGRDFYIYLTSGGINIFKMTDTSAPHFTLSYGVNKFFYDEVANKMLGLTSAGEVVDLTDASGSVTVKKYALALTDTSPFVGSNYHRFVTNAQYFCVVSNTRAMIFNREKATFKTVEGYSSLLLSGEEIWAVKDGLQYVSSDGGVSFALTGETITDAIANAAFINGSLLLMPYAKIDGETRPIVHAAQVSTDIAKSKFRVLRESY
ncbi:hypothetical protein [Pseudoalteromonas aurantia]|uniref:Uncharacterized protein n=1 Tax=Pseudoalteromonas aurantia 208 TaxID=1314867 RepID=A0ABR9EE15_9GAMM|nr:hypothetical protein [Pseudoalteromonas aurantia]MBE0369223.1 hypothetical protein [Pseudoalteromonas aurantia 208]